MFKVASFVQVKHYLAHTVNVMRLNIWVLEPYRCELMSDFLSRFSVVLIAAMASLDYSGCHEVEHFGAGTLSV